MGLIERARLTEEEMDGAGIWRYGGSAPLDGRDIADAQLAKALWAVVDEFIGVEKEPNDGDSSSIWMNLGITFVAECVQRKLHDAGIER